MTFARKGLRELEMLHERVVFTRNGAHNHCGIGRGFLVVEHIAFTAGATLDALQAPHEIKVPVATTKLAVGNHLQACGLLLCHQIANGNIFNSFKLCSGNGSRLEVSAGLLQHIGAQEATYHIATERRIVFCGNGHGFILCSS